MKLFKPKTILAITTLATSLAFGMSADAASTSVMYRLYNPNNHEHFYTSSTKERDNLVRIGWGNYEGPAWKAPTSGGHLVYRLYNKGLRDHHYTASWDEVQWLTKNYGWTYEGPAWRSANKNNHPIYRLFLKGVTSGSHHYTASWQEVQWLTKNYGWKYEGIGWYGANDDTTPTATSTTPTANKSALQALYTTIKGTKKGDFTDNTWNTFQSALSNAKKVLDNTKSTQNQVNDAKNKLDSAFKGLKHITKPATPQNYTVIVNHIDAQTGKVITNEKVTVKAGETYTANAKAFKFDDIQDDSNNFSYQVIGTNTQSKIINSNTTINFKYDEVHQIYIYRYDDFTGQSFINNSFNRDFVNVIHGQNATITALKYNDYIIDPRKGAASETVTLNNVTSDQEVNFAYTHQYTVTVNHIDVDTNTVLSTETKTVYEGDNFSTPWKNMTDQNYFLCRNDDHTIEVDRKGQRSINDIKQDKTITFKYKKISLDELRNSMRQKGLEWLNNYRQQNGVGPMQFNDIVQQAADIRAKEVRTKFSHYRPNDGTFQDLLESLGCYGAKGENLNGGPIGYIDEFLFTDKAIASLLSWKDSPAHNANMLYSNQSILGLGYDFSVEPDGTLDTPGVFISANPIFR